MGEMDTIIAEFLSEGNDQADELERQLLKLEKDPAAPELLAEVFRVVHSIKGATSFLGFTKLGALTHKGEGVLVRLRDGAMVLNPEIASVLLSLVDAIREILSEIAATGTEGTKDYAALIANLTRLQKAA